ncbi:NAD(P)-binding protein [Mollisia scopiformis]|uniref:NAD(P)-binding protein n=1 Tax=Mollisia scopiformis TaxID=149040 RepID=A0A132BEH5_MOLSC|nr:NAD(P)-binding protein [Mollisia scopiformis]KUJ10409.1 NAD(P)-binding protein [Mollisia scopiformis]
MAPHANTDDVDHDIVRLPGPERPPFSTSPPRLLIIGAGNRGNAYANAIQESTNGILVSVVEPIEVKRRLLGRKYIWGKGTPSEGQEFRDWKEFVAWELERRKRAENGEEVPEGVDGVFVCVQDQMHREVVVGLAPLELHVMCEKPLATSLDDCVAMYRSLVSGPEAKQKKIVSIGHVLRYSPHNMLLRKLLVEEKVIGDVMSVNHTEPVGWWHFTHSYVRGNWRKESTSAPSLLAKSCHDMDILLWLLCSPPPNSSKPAHQPSTISSAGSLQYFHQGRKPTEAGNATNCLSCAYEPSCQFSAKRIYVGSQMGSRQEHFVSIVLPEIEDCVAAGGEEAGEKALLERLSEDYNASTPASEVSSKNWYGRCVYEADNDVCDNQTVTLTWDNDPITSGGETPVQALTGRGAKIATLHMVAFSQKICQRFTNIYGVHGEIYADSDSITVQDFRTGQKKVHYPSVPKDGGHGDGDHGLSRQFVLAIDRVKNHGEELEEAQRMYIGCGVEEIIRSHAAVFAAEEARKGRVVVDFKSWWEREVEGRLKSR